LSWRLYFIGPALVSGENTPVWFQESYLHLIGPAIILIAALFISRAFDQMLRGMGVTVALCVGFWCGLRGLWGHSTTPPWAA